MRETLLLVVPHSQAGFAAHCFQGIFKIHYKCCQNGEIQMKQGSKKIQKLIESAVIITAAILLSAVWALNMVCCGSPVHEGNEAAGPTEDGLPQEANSIQPKLEEYLGAAVREWGFQGSVLVARRGQVILKTGRGKADADKEIPNTPGTKFQIGSITKTFTAAAVMKLVEKGIIELDAAVSLYLPELRESSFGRIKVHHLLSHTSGLPEISPGAGDHLSQPTDPETLIARIKGKQLEFEPGQKSRYSNSGYLLLGMILEKVTRETYIRWIDRCVLKPLGMVNTGVLADDSMDQEFARGYVQSASGELRSAPFIHPSWGYSAGALHSTVEDLLKWDRALASDKLLSERTLEIMFRRREDSFGYGWLINDVFGRRTAAHGGGTPGFVSWIERWLDSGVFVAVLSNVSGAPAGEIGRSLAAALLGERYEMPKKRQAAAIFPEKLDDFIGNYKLKNGDLRRIVREDNSLFVSPGEGPKYPLVPCGKDGFYFPYDKAAFIRFIRNGKGQVTGYIFHQLGKDERADKIASK